MKQEEFVKHITYNNIEIDVGYDDYGQSYFIEYKDNNDRTIIETVGTYISDYMGYIVHRFGKPEINCPVYHQTKTTETESCRLIDKVYCTNCRKFYNDLAWDAVQKRQKETARLLKEHYEKTNIT